MGINIGFLSPFHRFQIRLHLLKTIYRCINSPGVFDKNRKQFPNWQTNFIAIKLWVNFLLFGALQLWASCNASWLAVALELSFLGRHDIPVCVFEISIEQKANSKKILSSDVTLCCLSFFLCKLKLSKMVHNMNFKLCSNCTLSPRVPKHPSADSPSMPKFQHPLS